MTTATTETMEEKARGRREEEAMVSMLIPIQLSTGWAFLTCPMQNVQPVETDPVTR